MGFLQLLVERFDEVLLRSYEHIQLAGSACLTAICIGVPLGMFIARRRYIAGIVLGFTGVVQIIPSIAMLALLLVLLGRMGFLPAYVALVLYALLPVTQNTYSGMQNVESSILEAADGMGYTRRQRLWCIELPLASPIILAGIRTATIWTFGIATLSAFIGAGGLGVFIVRGLSMRNTELIMLGVTAAAILVLLFNAVLGLAEKLLKKKIRQIK